MLKRLRKLWYISSLDIGSNIMREVKLTIPTTVDRPEKKLATIVEDKPDYFAPEEIDNETLLAVLGEPLK